MALQDFFNELVLIHEVVEEDGLGTHTERYKPIGTFYGAVITVSSNMGMRGEQPHPATSYQLTTTKDNELKFNDIIQDGENFYQIVTDKRQTPKSANLSIQQFNLRKININVI